MLLAACLCCEAQNTFQFGTNTNPQGSRIEVDSYGFVIDGKHQIPVMGEMHYSRVPKADWRREIRKMKAGGITILSTYVFWIHHEAEEGLWDWSGNKDLREFISICGEEQMPVVLRIGPFSHGEVYQGGFPIWLTDKATADAQNYKLRTLAPGFMKATERLYANIHAQVFDLLWKDGGPIVGIQIENECRGPWNYYQALKDIAVKVGFDVPFYTRTGWPALNGQEVFGQMLPLYGDYADGFWDRKLTDMPGDYPKAFTMDLKRMSTVIATETFSKAELSDGGEASLSYPYLTCELGGGMMPSYHRRINMSGREAMPLAICKVGSGSNLPGYYMYHGGSNAYNPMHTMAETQRSATTAHNDMPHITYDFQCPLGEMGQPNQESFHQTRLFHQFLSDWGEELSQMNVDTLSEHYARRGNFEFYNDYVRILNEKGISYVRPVDMQFQRHLITAEAQPFCHIDKELYLIPIKGRKPIIWVDGKKYALKENKTLQAKDITICLLSAERARSAFKIDGKLCYAQHGGILYEDDNGQIVEEVWQLNNEDIPSQQTQPAGPARDIKLGSAKVAEQPTDEEFQQAAIWSIALPNTASGTEAEDCFLQINYQGDCARIYADGQLVEDNFWNGKPMLVRMNQLIGKHIELRILPLRKDAPIYLQQEQKALLEAADDVLLKLDSVRLLKRVEF